MTPSDTDLEARLRRDLQARADAAPPAPPDLAELTRRRHRSLRRREFGIVGAVLAAVLVLVGVPMLSSNLTADRDRGQAAGPPTGQDSMRNLADVPTRGSLAADDAWLADVRALDWVEEARTDYPGMEEIDPPLDTRHVSFAQDLPGLRVALVLGRWSGRWVHGWFVGPENAAPDQMDLAAPPSETIVGEPQALLDVPADSDDIRLVVVAFPGDTAEILVRRDVDPSGEVVESWHDLGLEDGTAVASLSDPPIGQMSAGGIWVHRDGERSQSVFPLPTARTLRLQPPQVDVADPRRLLGSVSDDVVQRAAQCLLGHFGGRPEDLGLTLLAGGPLGGSSMNQAALVGATFGSGAETACLVTQTTSTDPGSVTGTTVLVDAVPADDVPLVDEAFAVPALDHVAISGLRSGSTAEIYLADGTLLTTVPLLDGAGLGPLPPPAAERVRILAADGSVIVEAPMSTEAG